MFVDLADLIPLAKEAHSRSVFRDTPMNEAFMQRNFVTAVEFDRGYAKVVEDKGNIVGGLVGIISDNHYGIKIAQDLFCYSKGMTDRLIKDFALWAQVRGAEYVHITDLTGNEKYQDLLRELGFVSGGNNFVKVM